MAHATAANFLTTGDFDSISHLRATWHDVRSIEIALEKHTKDISNQVFVLGPYALLCTKGLLSGLWGIREDYLSEWQNAVQSWAEIDEYAAKKFESENLLIETSACLEVKELIRGWSFESCIGSMHISELEGFLQWIDCEIENTKRRPQEQKDTVRNIETQALLSMHRQARAACYTAFDCMAEGDRDRWMRCKHMLQISSDGCNAYRIDHGPGLFEAFTRLDNTMSKLERCLNRVEEPCDSASCSEMSEVSRFWGPLS